MEKRSIARVVNAVIAALITIIFLVHGAMGSLSAVFGFVNSFPWIVWGAVILAGIHVAVSLLTSSQQLGDVENPPSVRKKAHLALKWATGGLLAVCAVAHIVLPKSMNAAPYIIMAVSVLLAAHVCVCAKSLLADLGIDRRWKWTFRLFVCLLAALFVIAMLRTVM